MHPWFPLEIIVHPCGVVMKLFLEEGGRGGGGGEEGGGEEEEGRREEGRREEGREGGGGGGGWKFHLLHTTKVVLKEPTNSFQR